MTIPRISRKHGLRYINWSPYIRLLADKLAAMYNFSFLDLFEGNDTIIEKITKLEATKLQVFLYSFENIIDDIGINDEVKKVNTILQFIFLSLFIIMWYNFYYTREEWLCLK